MRVRVRLCSARMLAKLLGSQASALQHKPACLSQLAHRLEWHLNRCVLAPSIFYNANCKLFTSSQTWRSLTHHRGCLQARACTPAASILSHLEHSAAGRAAHLQASEGMVRSVGLHIAVLVPACEGASPVAGLRLLVGHKLRPQSHSSQRKRVLGLHCRQ